MRRFAALPLLAALTCSGVLLGGCGQNAGLALAQQACVHVHRSIALYDTSVHDPDAQRASAQRSAALAQLRRALPLAAQANSADGTWDALMTAISESSRVDESLLIVSLRATCASADNSSSGFKITVPT